MTQLPTFTTSTAPLPDRVRLPLQFDSERLGTDLASMPDDAWIDHFVQQNYEGGWSILPLRCSKDAVHPILMAVSDPSATEFKMTPWLEHAPYLRDALAAFQCPLASVRLMRLDPGSRIKPHHDVALTVEDGTVRLHIPVTTNPEVDFRLNGTRVKMEPGTCWFLRLTDEHSVVNHGTAARVHLVVDCLVNDWLLAQLNEGARA